MRCVECYSKEGQKTGRNGTIIGFPLITMIPISAAAVATYLFVDPCGFDPIFQDETFPAGKREKYRFAFVLFPMKDIHPPNGL